MIRTLMMMVLAATLTVGFTGLMSGCKKEEPATVPMPSEGEMEEKINDAADKTGDAVKDAADKAEDAVKDATN
jgi:hypothetical protein